MKKLCCSCTYDINFITVFKIEYKFVLYPQFQPPRLPREKFWVRT